MATRANIVVNDGAVTPVSHTFNPMGKPSGSDYEIYVERASGKPEFQSEIRIKTQQPSKSGQPYKVFVTMIQPKVVNVNGVDTLDRQSRLDLTFTTSSRSITQDRKDLRVMLSNLLANAQVIAVIDNLETIVG